MEKGRRSSLRSCSVWAHCQSFVACVSFTVQQKSQRLRRLHDVCVDLRRESLRAHIPPPEHASGGTAVYFDMSMGATLEVEARAGELLVDLGSGFSRRNDVGLFHVSSSSRLSMVQMSGLMQRSW